jgi:peptidoglycan/LPS O-acetylase OafA/YrhL
LGVIRIFLALSVVVWHLWGHALPFTVNGYNALFLFFIISGFYMSMVLNGKYSNRSPIRFYVARVLRIFPLYLLVLVLILWFLSAIGKPLPTPSTTREWLFVTVANVTTIGIPWVTNWEYVAIPPAWSLGIELLFYLVAPFILTRRLWICALLLLASIALRLSLLPQDINWLFTSPRADWCFFMLGASAHRLGLLVPEGRTRNVLGWSAAALLPIAGFLCGLPITTELDRSELWLFYLMFAASVPFIFSISLGSRIDRLLGDLSYPIYVVHWFVISFVGHFSGFFYRHVPYDYHREGDIVLVILAATVLHLFFERPIDNFRQRLSSGSKLGMRAPPAAGYDTARAATPAE